MEDEKEKRERKLGEGIKVEQRSEVERWRDGGSSRKNNSR